MSADRRVTVRKIDFPRGWKIFIILENKLPFIKKLRQYNDGIISSIAPSAGIPYDTESAATKSTRFAIVSIIPCVISGIFLTQNLHLGFIGIAVAPLLVFFAPFVKLKFAVQERRGKIEEEMAYFLSYVNIMQSVGRGLYQAFDEIRNQRIFPAMEKDARELVRRVNMLGNSQKQALSDYASHHPSESFRAFVSGYMAKMSSIGNVPAYTEAKAKYFFEEYMSAWERYEKSAQEIFSAVLMISIILPMMMAFNSMMGTASTASILIFAGTLISPLVAAVMISALNSSQPATGHRIKMAWPSFAAGGIVGITCMVSGLDTATSLALGVLVGAIVNYVTVRPQLAQIHAIDAMIPEFMRDVTEMSKTGTGINQIIIKQSGNYTGGFNSMLQDIAVKIRAGRTFASAAREIKSESTHVRFIMFLLSKAQSTGGGSPSLYLDITDFVTKIHQTKTKIVKGLTMLSGIVYFSPFMMLGITHMMVAIFATDTSTSTNSMAFDLSTFGSIDESIIDGISLMAVCTTAPMAVVASKVSSFTVKNTLPVAVTAVTTILAIHLTPVIIAMFGFGG